MNCDSHEIHDYTESNNGLKVWISAGVSDQILEYPDRKEIITEEALFNPISLDSLMGAPITFLHPPQAIDSSLNRNRFAKGTTLQEFVNDNGRLLMSGIVYDSATIKAIKEGEITHSSAGYYPIKELIDGMYYQKHRTYNHMALLNQDAAPRAGERCEVISFKPPTYEPENLMNTDSGIKPEQINNLICERVQLWTEWKDLLAENNLAVDYNLDSTQIKKRVLGIHYDDNVVERLDDSNIDGFWLSFVSQNRSIVQNTDSTQNYKTNKPDYRQMLISSIEGRS